MSLSKLKKQFTLQIFRFIVCLGCLCHVFSVDATELLVLGDADHPVAFRLQPLVYQGDSASPAIEIENILVAELSSSGLFYQPWQQSGNTNVSTSVWRLAGVRYLISGRITETKDALIVNLTIEDTLGVTPTVVHAELNTAVWQQATRVFSQQLFYSLFYATYTDSVDAHYLDNENRVQSKYYVGLVQTLKNHWHSQVLAGNCQVNVSQFPGGSIQSYAIEKGCHKTIAEEIRVLFEALEALPYSGFQSHFERHLKFRFVALD